MYIKICFRVHKKIKSTTYTVQIFNIFFNIQEKKYSIKTLY